MFLFNISKILLGFNFLHEKKIGHLTSCKLKYCLQSRCLRKVMLGSVMEGFVVGVREARPCEALSEKLY